MRKTTQYLALFLVAAAGTWFAGCNSTIDDSDGPNVVLEVENLTIPPVTATQDSTGLCTFTLAPATASFKNKPKNAGASESPFNDIILQSLDIAYFWDDGAGAPASATSGLGGSVPAEHGESDGVGSAGVLRGDRQGSGGGDAGGRVRVHRGTTSQPRRHRCRAVG